MSKFYSTSSKQFKDKLISFRKTGGSLLTSFRGGYNSEKALYSFYPLYPSPPNILSWLTNAL